ncbi:UNVERIFIED_CONTAM: hypothetical protein FKN15_013942 [Acipenser sinensis]
MDKKGSNASKKTEAPDQRQSSAGDGVHDGSPHYTPDFRSSFVKPHHAGEGLGNAQTLPPAAQQDRWATSSTQTVNPIEIESCGRGAKSWGENWVESPVEPSLDDLLDMELKKTEGGSESCLQAPFFLPNGISVCGAAEARESPSCYPDHSSSAGDCKPGPMENNKATNTLESQNHQHPLSPSGNESVNGGRTINLGPPDCEKEHKKKSSFSESAAFGCKCNDCVAGDCEEPKYSGLPDWEGEKREEPEGELGEEQQGDEEEEDDEEQESRMNGGGGGGMEERVSSCRKGGGKRHRNRAGSQRDSEAGLKHFWEQPSTKPASGGRHKQTRRRNNHHHQQRSKSSAPKPFLVCRELLEESVKPWCLSCFWMVVDLIVFGTHRCGEYVEAGGVLAYSCCAELLAQSTDLDSVKGKARSSFQWCQWRGSQAAERLQQAGHWLAGWACRLLKMLLALLCLVLMLCVGCLRLSWRYASSGFTRLSEKWWGPSFQQHCTFYCSAARAGLQRCWDALRETRTCGLLVGAWQRLWLWGKFRTAGLWGSSARTAPELPGSGSAGGKYQSARELERLLAMAGLPEEELDPFKVLGVEITASDMELKKAYRQLAVLVHPDKNKHPRAEEAFKVLRAAWDIVSNPETRRQYEIKRMAESELTKSMNEFLTKLQDDLREAMNTMMCSKCEGKHRRFELEREASAARYCGECNRRHGAEEGDFWAESSMLGLRITYFALMDGKVFDITEWAGCQRIGISPDTHRVPYHISFGAKDSASSGRQRTPSESSPNSAADLQDFFNRVFQGSPNHMPNGGFFSPPPAGGAAYPSGTATPTAASFSSSTAPPGQPRTDSTRPRRKKKFRRPF